MNGIKAHSITPKKPAVVHLHELIIYLNRETVILSLNSARCGNFIVFIYSKNFPDLAPKVDDASEKVHSQFSTSKTLQFS